MLPLGRMLCIALLASLAVSAEPRRIVAIGDLHGDLQTAYKALLVAGVVSREGKDTETWTGGDALLVQVGDLVDRGPDSVELIQLFERLREKARKAGGEVVTLLGNHEHLALTGNADYANPQEIREFKGGALGRKKAYSPLGPLGKLIVERPVVHIAEGTLFVHAGLHAMFASLGIHEINSRVRLSMLRGTSDVLLGQDGPVWMRSQLNGARHNECSAVKDALDVLSHRENVTLKRMVVGHTIQDGVTSYCNNTLWAIDVGMSRWIAGVEKPPEALEIIGDDVTAIPVRTRVTSNPAAWPSSESLLKKSLRRGPRRSYGRHLVRSPAAAEDPMSNMMLPFAVTVVIPIAIAVAVIVAKWNRNRTMSARSLSML
eukprot:Sspe_Gene.89061::Locus_60925_Transcript_1_1_Confidence_1.000_Length_1243::g.89061::m.89061